MDTKKILSALAAAGILTASVFGANVKATTGEEYLKPVGVYQKLVEGKTVVPYVLRDKNTPVTVKDIKSEFENLTLINGNAVTDESAVLGTGDIFTANGIEYTIVVYGDVTGDGKISTGDALAIQKYFTGIDTSLNDVELEAADVANNGEISTGDALAIQKYFTGINKSVINELPPEEVSENPVLSGITDGQTIYVKLNDTSFNLPEVTAVDANGEKLEVAVEGEVNISTENSYSVKYSATDSKGQVAEATIIVIVDGTAPTADVRYSTTEPTKDGVVVTIVSNELINAPEGWTLSEDGMSASKTYTAIVNMEEVAISDKAGNESKAYVTISNIDAEVAASITYNPEATKVTNGNVVATIESDEELQLIDGWSYVADSDNKKMEKTYSENTIEDVVVKDMFDNEITVQVNVQNIDRIRPTASVQYDVTRPTNGSVVVTIIASEELQSVSGTSSWSMVGEDKTRYSATFTESKNENVTIADLAGNTATIPVTVSNIDTINPTVTVKYDNEKPTNGKVMATITADEKLQPILGWTLSENQMSMTKEYEENVDEVVIVSDLAGNTAEAKVVIGNIDTTPPRIDGFTEGKSSYQTVTPTFNEGVATIQKNDGEVVEFTSGTEVNEEGTYVIVVTDAADNMNTVHFTIDKTQPVFNEEDLEAITLKKSDTLDLTVIATDTVDGEIEVEPVITFNPDSDNETVESIDTTGAKDGVYKLVYTATDEAGNSTTGERIVTVDGTPATIVSVQKSTEDVSNEVTIVVKFSEKMQLPDEEWSASDDELTFTKKYTEKTKETVVFKDKAGNETSVSIDVNNIDTVAPVPVTSYSETNPTNQPVKATITADKELDLTDELSTAGWTYVEGSENKAIEKTYSTNTEETVTIADLAGNKVDVEISIANIDTEFNMPSVEKNEENPTNENVTVTIKADEELKLTDALIEAGWELSEDKKSLVKEYEQNTEGDETVVVSDLAGNTQNVTVNVSNIDKTAPVVEGVENGLSYKEATPTFTETTFSLKKDGEDVQSFTSGTKLTEEGVYTLEVTDEAGNVTKVIFTIDTTAPELADIEDEGRYKEVIPTFEEGTAMLNVLGEGDAVTSSMLIKSGYTINVEGKYKLVLKDAAGNESTVTFTIDRTGPEFTNITEGSTITSATTPAATDNGGQAVTVVSLEKDGEEVEDYTSFTEISEDGDYTLTVQDDVGNETTVNFTIDTTAPEVEGVENDGSYKEARPKFDDEGGTVTATLQKESEEAKEFSSGTKIYEDGTYTLVVKDEHQNENRITFTIDNVAPVITNVEEDGLYNESKTPGTETLGDAATVELTKDGNIVEGYTSLTEISEEGKYQLTISDKAGNSSTVSFTIDKTFEGADITTSNNDKPTNGNVIVTVKAEEKMQDDETLSGAGWILSEDKLTMTKTYEANTATEGDKITVKDLAGNEKELTIKVTGIDKVAPTVDELTGVQYSSQDPDQESVTVTITANETIQLTEELEAAGWAYVEADNENKTKIEKTYTENTAQEGENVEITDIAGNVIETPVNVKVSNIIID